MLTRLKTTAAVGTMASLGLLIALAAFAPAQDQKAGEAAKPQDKPAAPQTKGRMFPDLAKALKDVPGCIGVETARTQSGKNVIFAWFKDKKSLLDWYNSPAHKRLTRNVGDEARTGHKPLQDIPDDVGPIMVIASLTMSDKPKVEGTTMPISQIAIELYKPLSGGLSVGGKFAPEGLEVPGAEKK